MTEEEYRAAFPSLADTISFAQWRGEECCGETNVIEGAIQSGERLLLWFSEGCRVLTDLESRPFCVSPCKITENYYVSCIYGEWKIHYFSSDTRKSWIAYLADFNRWEHGRVLSDWEDRVFKIKNTDTAVIKLIKSAILREISKLREDED